MKKINLKLSTGDDDAIMSALELLQELDLEETEEQAANNDNLIRLIFAKLSARSGAFTPEELRVIYAAVYCAHAVLSGRIPADAESKKDLAPYLFHYNRLLPQLRPISDMLQ